MSCWAAMSGSGMARARELLKSVGLGDRLDHYPVQLSGGEQQRVALARAFMVKPPILMADEPTGNLDSVNGAHVLDLLISLNRREGTTLVLVTHDHALAARADRIVTLRDGRSSPTKSASRPERAHNEALAPHRGAHRLARDALVADQVLCSWCWRWRRAWARSPACADSARASIAC